MGPRRAATAPQDNPPLERGTARDATTHERMINKKEFKKMISQQALKLIKASSKNILILGPALLALLSGCGSLETVKGDVFKVEKRVLPPDVTSFQLTLKVPGVVILRRSEMCPVEERRIWHEVEVSKQSAALAVPQGIGCGAVKFMELGERAFGKPGSASSNCGSHITTDRRPTGRKITGPWQTIRRKACGKTGPVRPGGTVRITFLRTRTSREYPVGAGGDVRFGREALARMRIYFSILKDMKIEARYEGAAWLQRLNLE